MTQRDRARLVALKKAKKAAITQREAAQEIGQSERHVRRLLRRLKAQGDKVLVDPELRGAGRARRAVESSSGSEPAHRANNGYTTHDCDDRTGA